MVGGNNNPSVSNMHNTRWLVKKLSLGDTSRLTCLDLVQCCGAMLELGDRGLHHLN